MILIGALLATCAGTAAVLASRPPSMIRRRLAQLSPRPVAKSRIRSVLITHELSRSGLGWSEIDLLRAKVVAALLAAALVAVVGLVIPIGPAFVVAAAYAGFVTPTVYVERAASRCRAEAERAMVALVEWTEALVASGRPVETALVAVAERGVGSVLVDGAIAAASRSYALGAPLFRALAREGECPMPNIGGPELLLILAVVLIVFGAGKLPDVLGQLGKGVRSFRDEAQNEKPAQATAGTASAASAAPGTTVYCRNCGRPNGADSKFCTNCGQAL